MEATEVGLLPEEAVEIFLLEVGIGMVLALYLLIGALASGSRWLALLAYISLVGMLLAPTVTIAIMVRWGAAKVLMSVLALVQVLAFIWLPWYHQHLFSKKPRSKKVRLRTGKT